MTKQEQVQLLNIADTEHEIFGLLKQRWSPRTFKEDSISTTDMNKLFEAARWSPSSNNEQPWRFIYATKGTQAYKKIVDCLSAFNKKWAPNAPVLLLTAYRERTKDGKENFHALHDLGLSLGLMTVQAQYMGIGLHHMAGVDWKKATDVFGVPEGYHITTAIALGYYGGSLTTLPKDLQSQETAERSRLLQEEFAFEGKWGK